MDANFPAYFLWFFLALLILFGISFKLLERKALYVVGGVSVLALDCFANGISSANHNTLAFQATNLAIPALLSVFVMVNLAREMRKNYLWALILHEFGQLPGRLFKLPVEGKVRREKSDSWNHWLSRWGYPAVKFVIGTVMKTFWIDQVEGRENLPTDGAALIAINHESYFDFLCFSAAADRQVHYLAAEKFFDHPAWKWLMRSCGCIRINRFNGNNLGAFREIHRAVKNGRLIAVFPEGTRTPDGRMGRGRTGIARLALFTNLPVIPVGIIGTYDILSRHDRFPKKGKVTIRIGRPLDLATIIPPADKPTVADLRLLTDEIMREIAALTGKPYIPEEVSHHDPCETF